MFSLAVLVFSALSLLTPAMPVEERAAVDSASAVKITTYGVNGSGCAPGTASATLSDDASTIQVAFNDFTPTVSTSDFRKTCQATLTVAVPAGKQFTVRGAAYDGYVQIASGTTVSHGSLYYFQGSVDQKTSVSTISGPVATNANLTNTFNTDSGIWSTCGGSAIVNVEIYVTLDGKSGYTTVDQAKIGPFAVRDC
ncbi:hypothetical protein DL96DRAFT_1580869 [Flagelloscypha sp. PMI_526]|nr:hypothetical protein DL96DRAFT_1580869 [Flagelloscypha sp. PMI_526]